jgi:V8-like Glu-specific endopeptidase
MIKIKNFLLCFTAFLSFQVANASAESSSGTGFFVSQDGYIVTNYHVISDSKAIKVKVKSGDIFDATIVRVDKSNDLAILKIRGNDYKPLNVQPSTNIKRGQQVYAIGFPQINIQGIEPKITDGVISSLSGISDEPTNYQISNPIQPGNSGGPLFTQEGHVIGVVVSTINALAVAKATGSIPQNINFAVKSNYLIELLNSINPQKFKIQQPGGFQFSKKKKFVDIVSDIESGLVLIVSDVSPSKPITKQSEKPVAPKKSPSPQILKPSEGSQSIYKEKTVLTKKECDSLIPDLKKNYPEKIDSISTVVNAGCVDHKGRTAIIYQIQINNVLSDINVDAIEATKKSQITSLCSGKDTRLLIDSVDVWYYYVDSRGADVHLIQHTKMDCPSSRSSNNSENNIKSSVPNNPSWLNTSTSLDGKDSYFMDKNSIVRFGKSNVKVFFVVDSNESINIPNLGNYQSMAGQIQFDCRYKTYRALSFSFHERRKGQGKLISSFQPKEGDYLMIPEKSHYEFIYNSVCSN